MKFQNIFYTTALSVAIAAGSSAAIAGEHESLDPVERHGGLEIEITEVEQQKKEAAAKAATHEKKADAADKAKMAEDTSMNHNEVDSMRETAADEVLPNAATRAVPGAPNAGKNPDIDPVAGEADYVEQ